ncbi:WD40-repeat-containing domain protein [Phlyctochytrium arcticum]|nr:WD40-repeat-containing domain protein [Phlyctochytrium arcticum]
MNEVTQFSAGHEDLIHDVAYDFYGTRLVTCSSDQKLKVWDMDEETGKWILNDSWKGHDSSVLKVSWAHPEYGQVFASCSFDRTARIWEEQEHEAKSGGRRWIEKAKLTDSKGTVQDLEFAPNHLGLKLATSSSDGIVRIYEAMDVVQLSHWTLMDELEIVAGSKEPDGHYCLSWSPSRFQPQMIVVGCGKENVAKIYRLDTSNKWQASEVLGGHADVVTDVAWAPNMGRSYQLIATASKDGHVRIFKLTDESSRQGLSGGAGGWQGSASAPLGGPMAKSKKKFRVEIVADFQDHGAEVWRVDWNITGTILSSSGDDGKVRLWKASFLDEWKCMSIISAEQAPTDYNENAMR